MKNYRLFIVFYIILYIQKPGEAQNTRPVFNITDYGAIGDGRKINTVSIQTAIDLAQQQGGTVLIPPGRFLSGSIYLKSGVELHLADSAVLLGSTDRFDYKKITWHALVLAKDQENIAISGRGTIDGQGAELAENVVRLVKSGRITDPYWGNNRPHERERPQLIEFVRCKNVRISDLRLINSACWVQTYERCDKLEISRIRVESRAYWNNDGIDLVDSRNVWVHDCEINSADDGICLKSSFPPAFCDSILIENCSIRSSASALKFGTASKSGFRNVRVRNLHVADTYRSAVALEIVDGGFMENIDIGPVEARNTGNALFIRLGHRNTKADPGTIRGIRIHDLTVEVPQGRPDAGYAFEGPAVNTPHNLIPSSISGLPGHPVRDVSLENILIRFGGGGLAERAYVSLDSLDNILEYRQDYPEFSMFGELPAWGFFIRHVEGLHLKNVRLECLAPDFRPAIVCDDVQNLNLRRVEIESGTPEPALVFRQVRKALLRQVRQGGRKAEVIRK